MPDVFEAILITTGFREHGLIKLGLLGNRLMKNFIQRVKLYPGPRRLAVTIYFTFGREKMHALGLFKLFIHLFIYLFIYLFVYLLFVCLLASLRQNY